MSRDSNVSLPKLVIFSGLPGVGKSSIARELARGINAVYLRIDSIEQALRDSAALIQPMNDAGYRVAYAMAEDNLSLGLTVVADCVNPISITRDAWRDVRINWESALSRSKSNAPMQANIAAGLKAGWSLSPG